jgi:hypothetical protein
MTRLAHLAGRGPGFDVELAYDDLQRQTLVLGKSNAGKTNFAKGVVLSLQRADCSLTVNDAGGTLFSDVAATNAAYLYRLERKAEGGDPTAAERLEHERARTKYLYIQPSNPTGIAFDLLKLRTTIDPVTGVARPETVAERVSDVMGVLSHQRGKEAEIYNIISRTGPSAFAALIAAGGYSVRDLFRLLDPLNVSFRAEVAQKINRSPYLNEQIVRDAYDFFRDIARSPHRWDENVDSTVRMFGFLKSSAAFFDRDSFDYQSFHDAGGRLFVNFAHADARDEALMRRLLLALWFSATAARTAGDDTPASFCFLDEVKGIEPETLVAHMLRSRNKRAYMWIAAQSAAQFGDHFPTLLGAAERLVLFTPSSEDDAKRFVAGLSCASVDGLRVKTLSATTGHTETAGRSSTWQQASSEQETDGWHDRAPERTGDSYKALLTTATDELGHEVKEEKQVRTWDLAPSLAPAGEMLASGSRGSSRTSGIGGASQWSRASTRTTTTGSERVGVAEQMQLEVLAFAQLPPHFAYFLSPGRRPTLVHVFEHRGDWKDKNRRMLARREFQRQRALHYRAPLVEAYTFAFPVIGGKEKGAPSSPPPPRPTPPAPRGRPQGGGPPKDGPRPAWAPRGKGRAV